MSPDEGGQRSPDEGGGRGTTSEGLLAKAEAVVPWAEAEAGSTIAGGFMAREATSGQEWASPWASNLGPRRQGGAKKGRFSLSQTTYTKQEIFRECAVVVVGQRCKREK